MRLTILLGVDCFAAAPFDFARMESQVARPFDLVLVIALAVLEGRYFMQYILALAWNWLARMRAICFSKMRMASCKYLPFAFFSSFILAIAFVAYLLVAACTEKTLASMVIVVREAGGACLVVPPVCLVVK